MARPRTGVVWDEHPAHLVYVKQRKAGYSVFDLRGEGRPRERTRRSLDEAIDLARALAAEDVVGEMTLAELALDYFRHGAPVWEGTEELAWSEDWAEDQKGYVRTWYSRYARTRAGELPEDFIAETVERARRAGRSKSLQDKLAGFGHKLVNHGKAIGQIPRDRAFARPRRAVRQKKARRRGQALTVQHHTLPSHRQVQRFARAFAGDTGLPHLRLFWWLAFYMGFRVGELVALTVDDVFARKGRVMVAVVKKVRNSRSRGLVLEHYAKGYLHRDVVVPRLLERPLLARVAAVRADGGTLLFPSWATLGAGPAGPRASEGWLNPDSLHKRFVKVGASIGWQVKATTAATVYRARTGEQKYYRAKPSSLEFRPHTARAFAASAMHAEARGMSLRGMAMSVSAIAKQLGDLPETVRAHYLGQIEDDDDYLPRVVR